VGKGRGNPFAPIVLSLTEKRFDKQPAGITQHGDEQEDAHPFARDPDAFLPNVDLQLVPGRAFDPDRRQRGGSLRAPQIRDCALDRPNTDPDAALPQQSCTTTALPPAAPSYSARASRRASSVKQRAVGRTCTPATTG
jgi:hypothetical protein